MAHGAHGGGATALPFSPEDLAQLDEILKRKREAEGVGVLSSSLDRASAIYRGEPATQVRQPELDDELKAFVMRRQAIGKPPSPDDDPSSPSSAAARTAILQTPHGKAIADSLGDRFGSLSASQLKNFQPMYRANVLDPVAQKAKDDAREDEQRFRAEEAERGRAFRGSEGEKSRAAQIAAAEAAAGRKREEKDRDNARKLYIGEDFADVGGDRDVAPPVLAETQKQIVNAKRVLANVDRVDALLKTNPNGVLVGDDAVKLAALVESIKLREKEIQGLGVLNGQDYAILSRMVADPTSLREGLKSGAGVRPLQTAFRALRELTLTDGNEAAKSLGFAPKAGSAFAPKSAPRGKRPTRTVNGETREWDGKAWVPVGG